MIIESRIDGARLAGNLLGDPTERNLYVYLPPGYETSGRRYPTAVSAPRIRPGRRKIRPSCNRRPALGTTIGGRPRPGLRTDGSRSDDRRHP